MIKRLKWNVLHADDDDNPGGLSSSSSDESEQDLPPTAALQVLIENDPQLNASGPAHSVLQSEVPPLSSHWHSKSRKRKKGSDDKHQLESTSDEESTLTSHSEDADEEHNQQIANVPNEQSTEQRDDEFYEWQECLICPGKKFFNQEDLSSHLQSKKHLKAIRKQNELRKPAAGNTGKQRSQTEESSDVDDKRNIGAKNQRSSTMRLDKSNAKSNNRDEREPPQVLHPNKEASVNNGENNTHDEQERVADEEEARKRATRKKEVTKRKLRSLKRRKWEKKVRDRTVNATQTECK
ncbi:unnamed protein product [Agarophyton chilense]